MTMKYVLISPARNEQDYIEKTLEAVIKQSILPMRWLIVDDNSSDNTAEIVRRYANEHKFIHLLSTDGDKIRNFGSKAKAVNFAYEQLRSLDFDYIGNLDADIAFGSDYYKQMMWKMESNPRLGLAGGQRYDLYKGKFEYVGTANNSVGGPIQFFRKACFEAIGGYKVLPFGGIDAVAETHARMLGWDVENFPEFPVYHYRATGTANRSIWQAKFRAGMRDYSIGYHPVFEFIRSIRRFSDKPYVLGSVMMFLGYMTALIQRQNRSVSDDLVQYLQQEQVERLKQYLPKFRLAA